MSSFSEFFKEGLDAYELGRYQDAEQAFLGALDLFPEATEALLNLGNACLKQNKLKEAETAWKAVLGIDPIEKNVYFNLGNLYYQWEQYEQAVYFWEIYSRLAPRYFDVHLNMGLAYQAMGNIPEAFKHYHLFRDLKGISHEVTQLERRMFESKRIAEHNSQQAERHLRAGELEKAKAAYEASIPLYPLSGKIYKHYAFVLYQLNHLQEAIQWYQYAAEGLPVDMTIWINLGILYEKLKQPFLSLWAYSEARHRGEKRTPEAIHNRLASLWEEGDMLLQKAFKQIEQDMRQGNFAAAQAHVEKIHVILQDREHSWVETMEALLEELKIKKHPLEHTAKLFYEKATHFYTEKDYERAIDCYDRYLKLMPDGEFAAEAQEKKAELLKILKALTPNLLPAR